jgi:hypothetical protein
LEAPIYTQFKYIYTGAYVEDEADARTWFSIPIKLDKETSTITYLFFPYGGTEDEITEIPIEVPASWIG